MKDIELVSLFSENENSYKCMLFTTNLFIANLLKHLRSCQLVHELTGLLPIRAVKRQLFKLVIYYFVTESLATKAIDYIKH